MRINVITLGIDPDTHATGVAICYAKRVVAVGVYKVPLTMKGDQAVLRMIALFAQSLFRDCQTLLPQERPSRIVVEGQQIYLGTSRAVPDSILHVAQVAGAALAATALLPITENWALTNTEKSHLFFPRPREWKGSVPKDIHQARILMHFGWEYEKAGIGAGAYCRPTLNGVPEAVRYLTPVGRTDWKHIVDAMGLAAWGAVQNS